MKIFHNFFSKNRLPYFIIASLLVLLLLSTTLISRSVANFVKSDTGGDSARVAKFALIQEGITEQTLTFNDIYPSDDSFSKGFKIENDGEVALSYTLTATNTDNLPIDISINDQDTQPFVFTGELAPGASDNYTIEIDWPSSENDYKYTGMVDYFKVTISAVQID